MGWDIRGYIEVRLPWIDPNDAGAGLDPWYPLVGGVGLLVGRNYDAFGCLFGFQNHANFVPIAAERGLPPDASTRVRDEAAHAAALDATGLVSPSWVTWMELEGVDWGEPAAAPDSRVHRYVRDERGNWVFDTKASWDWRLAEPLGTATPEGVAEALLPPYPQRQEGQEWELGGYLYRAERLRRRDAIGAGWEDVFALMRTLARQFTPAGVRLVVWFCF
jgi:hypothetical protein